MSVLKLCWFMVIVGWFTVGVHMYQDECIPHKMLNVTTCREGTIYVNSIKTHNVYESVELCCYHINHRQICETPKYMERLKIQSDMIYVVGWFSAFTAIMLTYTIMKPVLKRTFDDRPTHVKSAEVSGSAYAYAILQLITGFGLNMFTNWLFIENNLCKSDSHQ